MIVYLNGVSMLFGGPSVLTVGVVHCPIVVVVALWTNVSFANSVKKKFFFRK